MAQLSLKVSVVDSCVVKTMQFDPLTIVFDACRIIREKVADANCRGNPGDYGLFLADEDTKKGIWMESGRALEYYLLRDGDLLEYKKKMRTLKVGMLDGSVKTVFVDDSHTVSQLMITICSKIGITNHEEYSLVRDLPDAERMKTLTIKRDKSIAKDQKKLDEMKKKLHTDDELDWLDHSKTLREQGVDTDRIDQEILLLRRKYFFSDQNVDARDPVQLNLLYVQTRESIIKGALPISQEQAIQFAGLQSQIQFGDHIETKHKSGYLDLKEFLPKEYVKVKGIDKKIFAEHKKWIGQSEVEAKAKYTQLARSLPTYGITFFLVKEKMKGKNKMIPRLMGITKESVVRVDENTKEILKTWPLTTVKRWAASPNSFTLDFGDYADSYTSVQTMEGEQISQLISGYIDIILKKKQAKDHFGIDGDDESTMYEDSVSPSQATIMQHRTTRADHADVGSVALPAVLRVAQNAGQSQFTTGSMQNMQFGMTSNQAHSGQALTGGSNAQMHGLGTAQRALFGIISEGLDAVNDMQSRLNERADLPQLGTDPASMKWKETTRDLSQQKVGSELSAMNAATAQIVTLTSGSPEDTNYAAVGSAAQTISTNLREFSRDIHVLATLDEVDGNKSTLLLAAKSLAGAFSDFLTVVQPGSTEPRQAVLNAASRIGDTSRDIMHQVDPIAEQDEQPYKTKLECLAKDVASAASGLVLRAKSVAAVCRGKQEQNAVINSASRCAVITSQLVTCTKVLASTISSPDCQEQLVDAARQVARAVDDVVASAQDGCTDKEALHELGAQATELTLTLDDLMQHVKKGLTYEDGIGADEVDAVFATTERLLANQNDSVDMVRQAQLLGQATSLLVSGLREEAGQQQDSERRMRLLTAANALAEATANLIEAAKTCAQKPTDRSQQDALKAAAEQLRTATSAATEETVQKQIWSNLQRCARNAASASTQVINMSGAASRSNTNQSAQQQLDAQCRIVSDDMLLRIVQALRTYIKDPTNPSAQAQLIAASQDFVQPCSRMLTAVKAVLPTVTDQSSSIGLASTARNLTTALAELRAAAGRAHETLATPPDMDLALEQVRGLEAELRQIQAAVNAGSLVSLPGESGEMCAQQLGATSKSVGTLMAQLLTASLRGDEEAANKAARATAAALRVLTDSIRGIAATTTDRALQKSILEYATDIMDKSSKLIEETKRVLNNPDNPENKTRLAQVAKAISGSLSSCVGCLPGLRDVEQAVKCVSTVTMKLQQVPQFPSTPGRNIYEIQVQLNSRAATLNEAATNMVTVSQSEPQNVALSSNRLSRAYEDFVDGGLEMAGATKDPAKRTQIVTELRSISMVTSRLLLASRSLLADPNTPNAKNQLTQAARAVSESINQLINVCAVAAPVGQKECDSAFRQIQTMRPLLANPSEPVLDAIYSDCLDAVIDKSKALAESMAGISNCAKKGELSSFCESVTSFGNAICGMAEHAAQAAYLVAICEPGSEMGRPALFDVDQFTRCTEMLQQEYQTLSNDASNGQHVLAAGGVIAKQCSAVSKMCHEASLRTTNAATKQQLHQSAKAVALSTVNLVKAVKILEADYSDANRQNCQAVTKTLLQAVEQIASFISAPEFARIPARITEKARVAQVPITSAGLDIVNSACQMIEAAKLLAVNPKDPSTYQKYSAHSHDVSESIKKIVSAIRDSVPGGKECDGAVELMNECISELDRARLTAMNTGFAPVKDGSLEGFQDQVINCVKQLLEYIDPIHRAALAEPENLGHVVSLASNYLGPLKTNAICYASCSVNSKLQMDVLDQTKTVVESLQNLLVVARQASANNKAGEAQAAVSEMADSARDVLNELLQTMEDAASSSGFVAGLVENLNRAIASTEDPVHSVDGATLSYVDYQTTIVRLGREMATKAQEMLNKSVTNVQELGTLGSALTRDYSAMATACAGAVSVSAQPQMASRIKTSIQQLGTSCIVVVQDGGSLQCNPSDAFTKRTLAEHTKALQQNISDVLSAVQAGSRGTQACINAANTVSGIIADLDTTAMFAQAGTLQADEGDSFVAHREDLLKTAKCLVEDTKRLVAGAASNQELLAEAAQASIVTITSLADCVKRGAASIGSEQPDAQVLLINAVKDVASALSDLIVSTKNAAGKSTSDPAMSALKDSAKVMVTNVTSLLKTVKAVEDEASRGTQALESSIEVIGQEMRSYQSTDRVEKTLTVDEVVRFTKPMSIATAKAVAAGNSGRQQDIIIAANMGRKAISDLLHACKGGAAGVTDEALKQRLLNAGNSCASTYKQLLQAMHVMVQKPSPENKTKLAELSKQVAACVAEVVHSLELIKGSDCVDPFDPTVVAENELLSAANSIEAAARKLASLQPKPRPKEADESLNFEEQLLEAATSIAGATAALVKAASIAQKELVAQGKVGAVNVDVDDDSQWSEGLVSAARLVAAATHNLCDAANAKIQGQASEEKLISSAKQVAASTAQLLVACMVKADPNSVAMHRLQNAGNAVKRATAALVREAQQAQQQQQQQQQASAMSRRTMVKEGVVSDMAQFIAAQAEILKKERELEEARQHLAKMRKEKYSRSSVSDLLG